MRIPIAYALTYPHRLKGSWKPLDLTQHGELNFLAVDSKRFPALRLAYAALKEGGSMSAVLNAANEVAVAAFLERKVGFRDIHRIIDETKQAHVSRRHKEVDEVVKINDRDRQHT